MTPFQSRGIGHAIVDGAVLARCLMNAPRVQGTPGAAAPARATANSDADSSGRIPALTRQQLLGAVHAYHTEMSSRTGQAVMASAHACNWFHFSTSGGVAFRTVACLLAQVMLWLGAVGQIIAVVLFLVICYYLFHAIMWVVHSMGVKEWLLSDLPTAEVDL